MEMITDYTFIRHQTYYLKRVESFLQHFKCRKDILYIIAPWILILKLRPGFVVVLSFVLKSWWLIGKSYSTVYLKNEKRIANDIWIIHNCIQSFLLKELWLNHSTGATKKTKFTNAHLIWVHSCGFMCAWWDCTNQSIPLSVGLYHSLGRPEEIQSL